MFRNALATLAVSATLSLPLLAAEAPSKVVEKALAIAPDGRLAVETYKGRVTVTPWERNEVAVKAVVRPDGDCDESAELVAKTRVRIEGGGREVRLVSDYDDLPKFQFVFGSDCSNRPFVDWDVRVPRGASVEIDDYKSRIDVEGVSGDVAVESYKGSIRLRGLSGRLEVETYKGDARAELDRLEEDVRLETYKGRIELVAPKGARAELREDVGRRGRLESTLDSAGGGPRVAVSTYKGTIRLLER